MVAQLWISVSDGRLRHFWIHTVCYAPSLQTASHKVYIYIVSFVADETVVYIRLLS
jgi:hypothetical protein